MKWLWPKHKWCVFKQEGVAQSYCKVVRQRTRGHPKLCDHLSNEGTIKRMRFKGAGGWEVDYVCFLRLDKNMLYSSYAKEATLDHSFFNLVLLTRTDFHNRSHTCTEAYTHGAQNLPRSVHEAWFYKLISSRSTSSSQTDWCSWTAGCTWSIKSALC